jgi:hypothetical protein
MIKVKSIQSDVVKGSGLGDRVQTVIHAGLDALPMNPATRNAIKSCGGCKKRKEMLNKAGEAIKGIISG